MIDNFVFSSGGNPETVFVNSTATMTIRSSISNTPSNSAIVQQQQQHHHRKVNHSSSSPTHVNLPFPTRKFIVYLEPLKTCPFYQSILDFFRLSLDKFGKNEAHMYHPHTSLTGFFDLPIDGHDSIDDFLVETLDKIISKYSFEEDLPSVHCGTIHRPHRHPSNTLSIKISTPSIMHDIISEFKSKVDDLMRVYFKDNPPQNHGHKDEDVDGESYPSPCTIRQKPMDHISLAYLRNVTAENGSEELSEETVTKLHDMAKEIINFEQPSDWFIVLYAADRSHDISTSHVFKQLQKWKISKTC